MQHTTINEAVYYHSASRANSTTCLKRYTYWLSMHERMAHVLGLESLVCCYLNNITAGRYNMPLPAHLTAQAV